MKSSDRRDVNGDGVAEIIIYGYKVRITDEDLRSRHILAANIHEGDDYTIDSDLNYDDGYLMDENEYTVLLEVADSADYVAGKEADMTDAATNQAATKVSVVSQPSNLFAAANSKNPNQDEIDRYGRMPVKSNTKVMGAGGNVTYQKADADAMAATLTYDLAKGADRANNDGASWISRSTTSPAICGTTPTTTASTTTMQRRQLHRGRRAVH